MLVWLNVTVTTVQGRGWWSQGFFPKLHKYMVPEEFLYKKIHRCVVLQKTIHRCYAASRAETIAANRRCKSLQILRGKKSQEMPP